MLGYISIVVWWAGCAIIPWAGFIWWFWSGEFAAPEVAVVFGEVFVEEMVQVRFVVDGLFVGAVGEPGFAFGTGVLGEEVACQTFEGVADFFHRELVVPGDDDVEVGGVGGDGEGVPRAAGADVVDVIKDGFCWAGGRGPGGVLTVRRDVGRGRGWGVCVRGRRAGASLRGGRCSKER